MRIIACIGVLFLIGCTTPATVLKHPETGQIARCGGDVTGSLAGGVIGYQIQKSNGMKCVQSYQNEGFQIESVQ